MQGLVLHSSDPKRRFIMLSSMIRLGGTDLQLSNSENTD